jgi:hypothetical protein
MHHNLIKVTFAIGKVYNRTNEYVDSIDSLHSGCAYSILPAVEMG